MKLIVPLLKRYKSVAVPVLTRYTRVTATSNIYYNTSLLRNNNGSSQLDLFVHVNYRGSSFYERVCSFVFSLPLCVLCFSLILRSRILTFQIIVFREKIPLLLDRLVLQYTYTTLLVTLHTGIKTLKVTLLNAFGLN